MKASSSASNSSSSVAKESVARSSESHFTQQKAPSASKQQYISACLLPSAVLVRGPLVLEFLLSVDRVQPQRSVVHVQSHPIKYIRLLNETVRKKLIKKWGPSSWLSWFSRACLWLVRFIQCKITCHNNHRDFLQELKSYRIFIGIPLIQCKFFFSFFQK